MASVRGMRYDNSGSQRWSWPSDDNQRTSWSPTHGGAREPDGGGGGRPFFKSWLPESDALLQRQQQSTGPGRAASQEGLNDKKEADSRRQTGVMMDEGDRRLIANVTQRDWLERARKSVAGQQVDKVLREVAYQSTIDRLKDQMFHEVYRTMGDEFMPEDMLRAHVVKTERYHPWLVLGMCLATCGIFMLFRPRDDEAVMVLTKNERICMYKVERVGVFQNFENVFRAALYVAAAFAAISIGPGLVVQMLGAHLFQKEVELAKSWQSTFESHVVARMERNLWLQVVAWVIVALAFSFWIWTKFPHDYGIRQRQSHAANKICCCQLGLSGGLWNRVCRLRLFFGRYPDQGALDANMNLRAGAVAHIMQKQDLALTNSSNPFSSTGRRSFLVFIIILLNVFTVMDALLTYGYTPYEWISQADSLSSFCEDAYSVQTCEPLHCLLWAEANASHVPEAQHVIFCREVHWLASNITQSSESTSRCADDRVPPCCAGCVLGSYNAVLSRGMDILQLIVSLVTDVGTVTLTLAAVAAAFAFLNEKDHVDIRFRKRVKYNSELAHFDLTQLLAMDFINAVFDNAFRDNSGEFLDGQLPKRKIASTRERPDYRRSKRYEHLAGDDFDSANVQDVTCFDIDAESQDWTEFFETKSLVQEDRDPQQPWIPRVTVPTRVLGIDSEERVLAAWVEKPLLNKVMLAPIMLICMLIWFGMMLSPASSSELFFRLQWLENSQGDKFVSASLWALSTFVLLYLTLWIYLYATTKHVCILTDVRLFYVRYQDRALLFCRLVPQLRIDTFRHDHEVTYGSMKTHAPNLYQRATGAPWTPGTVYMQPGFYGLLQLHRERGSVLNIYQAICQLTKPGEKPFIDSKMIEEAGVSFQHCAEYVRDNMVRSRGDVWRITHRQPDDEMHMMPDMYVSSEKELPLFYWSFKEFGWISSAKNVNTDLVITTHRVYIFKRNLWKQFDAKTCCCFGLCWCPWLWRLWQGKKGLRRQSSFLDLRLLLTFSTEVEISPPVWVDPLRWPCRIPCFDTLMEWFTACLTCRGRAHLAFDGRSCSLVPRRAGARAQLWIMWRHRFNSTQADLTCTVRPYNLRDPTLVSDVLSFCGCGREVADTREDDDRQGAPDYQKIEDLRKIMGVVQDAANAEEFLGPTGRR